MFSKVAMTIRVQYLDTHTSIACPRVICPLPIFIGLVAPYEFQHDFILAPLTEEKNVFKLCLIEGLETISCISDTLRYSRATLEPSFVTAWMKHLQCWDFHIVLYENGKIKKGSKCLFNKWCYYQAWSKQIKLSSKIYWHALTVRANLQKSAFGHK